MGEIEELKQRLEFLKKEKKRQLEIKKLKRQIKGEEFSQTTGGKVFNKIADVGEGLGKMILGKGEQGGTPKKKGKIMSVEEVMRVMPQ